MQHKNRQSQKSRYKQYIYLGLAILGLILPYTQLLPFMEANGPDIILMVEEVFASHGSAFFAMDLLVTAVTAVIFIILDARQNSVRLWWTAILAVFLVGISLALPLYLLLREKNLEKAGAGS